MAAQRIRAAAPMTALQGDAIAVGSGRKGDQKWICGRIRLPSLSRTSPAPLRGHASPREARSGADDALEMILNKRAAAIRHCNGLMFHFCFVIIISDFQAESKKKPQVILFGIFGGNDL